MADRDQIVYQLSAMCRYDKDAEIFIGYIPSLQVYTQAKTKERLTQALHSTATQFILACADQKILFSVLREAGAKKASAQQIQERRNKNVDFIGIADYHECEDLVEVKVPFSFLQDPDLISA